MLKTSWFEKIIIQAVTVLLMVVIGLATVWLVLLFALNAWHWLTTTKDVIILQEAVQRSFSGIFIVLLGLELLETLKTYVTRHHIRLQVVLVVGAIAVARHIIQLDFQHTDGLYLLGFAALIVALVYGYFLLQRLPESQGGSKPEEPAKAPEGGKG